MVLGMNTFGNAVEYPVQNQGKHEGEEPSVEPSRDAHERLGVLRPPLGELGERRRPRLPAGVEALFEQRPSSNALFTPSPSRA